MMGPERSVRCVRCVLRALCVLAVLHAAAGADADADASDYCARLEHLQLGNISSERRLSAGGAPRRLLLAGGGAAAAAAHALLAALLRHALRYRARDLARTALPASAARLHPDYQDSFILSVASARCDESEGSGSGAGSRLAVLAPGAAPLARRVLARLAPGAQPGCLRDWQALQQPSCGFLHRNCTCSPSNECADVMVSADEDIEEDSRQVHYLRARVAALAPGLSLCNLSLSDLGLRRELRSPKRERSFLFLDADLWADGDAAAERVWPAPPLPCPAGAGCPAAPEGPVSVLVADERSLTRYAPPVMQLARRFRPTAAMLRWVLFNATELGLPRAACKVAFDSRTEVRDWLECKGDVCDPRPHVRIYVCEGNTEYYYNITLAVKRYWNSEFKKKTPLHFDLVITNCSDTDAVNRDVKEVIVNWKMYAEVQAVVAMGAAAASPLPHTAALAQLPALLVAAPPWGAAGARSTAAPVAALAAALRGLLAACGWRRLTLLREESCCDIWSRAAGVRAAWRASGAAELVLAELVLQVGEERAALDALRAQGARVVLLDASARAAARLLSEAQAQRLTPAAGYAWLVLGSAALKDHQDWRPEHLEPEFSYVTVSGGWRGGSAPGWLGGSAGLRAALDGALGAGVGARAGAWGPHAAPLADAILLLLEGERRLRAQRPQYRHDPHNDVVNRELFEQFDNIMGVTYEIRSNASPPVFAHRWDANGAQLMGVWGAGGEEGAQAEWRMLDKRALCAVADLPACYTTRSGDPFNPYCHDVAFWALLAGAGVGLPCALWARRRLQLRDRRLEERALQRAGHSPAEAADGAALAEHEVPPDALVLLDELGAGHYGTVRRAVLRRADGATTVVAAKAPHADAPAGSAGELLREAALLATLRHEHVVRFAGVRLEGGPLLLMERAFHGDLRRYLRARRPLAERARAGRPEPEAAHVSAAALTRLAREAAAALDYLAHCGLVHRDVRAANCLVDARRSLKLADFGMARRAVAGTGEYACRRRAMFPVLWMAPESLADGVSSPASDVWALGVLLLELATLGERPYGAWPAERVRRHVCAGGTAPMPRDAAPATRSVAAACWRRSARARPTAAQLAALLAARARAVRPALEPPADADALSSPDSGLYVDEWNVE